MVTTADPVKLRRRRRIVWYTIFALFILSAVSANFGFNEAGGIVSMLVFPTLLYALLLGYRIGRAERAQAKLMAKDDIKLQPYGSFLIGNLLFSALVAFWCSFSAMLVFFFGMVVMVVLLPMALNVGKESRELRRQRWSRFAIYAIAVSVGWVLDHQASENEQRNFDNIIAAVEQYQAAEKHYPDTLEQLVPKYLTSVPTARLGKKFLFSGSDTDNATLMHMPMPFVHESYNFKSKTRRTWD